MKKAILLTLGFIAFGLQMKAQIGENAGITTRYTIGASAGATLLNGDLPKKNAAPAIKVNFDYNLTTFISVGAEAQLGQIAAGQKGTGETWYAGLYNKSNYGGLSINGRIAAGQFLNDFNTNTINIVKRIYISSGVGVLQTSVSEVQRGTSNMGGKDHSTVVCIPANVGIDIPLTKSAYGIPKLLFNINYQFNFIMSDDFDAFNYQVAGTNKKDAYSLISAGFRLNLGKACYRNL